MDAFHPSTALPVGFAEDNAGHVTLFYNYSRFLDMGYGIRCSRQNPVRAKSSTQIFRAFYPILEG